MQEEPKWQKMPTATEVEAHLANHPFHFRSEEVAALERQPQGCNWLVEDRYSIFPGVPQIVRLRVKDGRVMLNNGFSMWQPLDETKWAERSRWIPLTRDGLPAEGR